MKQKYRSLGKSEVPCPRCGEFAQAREHPAITEKQLRQPYDFVRWFNCINGACATGIFMRDEFKVVNKNAAAKKFEIAQTTIQQMNAFREELDQKLRTLLYP